MRKRLITSAIVIMLLAVVMSVVERLSVDCAYHPNSQVITRKTGSNKSVFLNRIRPPPWRLRQRVIG